MTTTIVAMDVNMGCKVRVRASELLPSLPSAWSDAGSLEEVIGRLGDSDSLALMLMTASLDLGPSVEHVGSVVIQRHIVVEGNPVRVVEYELS